MDKANPEVVASVLEHVFSLFKTIYCMAMNIKANKERCTDIAQRVKSIEKLVQTIQQRGPGQISVSVQDALMDLYSTLESVKAWMAKFYQTKRFMSFIKSGSHEEKFNKLDKRLSETFSVLSVALQVEQGDRLDRVYDTISQRGTSKSHMPLPSFTPPSPAPSGTETLPSNSTTTPMPLPGPTNYSLGWNPDLFSPAVNPALTPYPPGFQPYITYPSNAVCTPTSVTQIINVSSNASLSAIAPFTNMILQTNSPFTAYAYSKSYYY